MIAARYLIPYRRLFPIWRYGPMYSLLDGYYVRDGWRPDWFGAWEFSTEAEALTAHKSLSVRVSRYNCA